MGNAWSTHKSKREEKAKAKRLRSEHCVRSPDSRLGISERLPIPTSQMKDSNLFLEENKHVDENELATSEDWKLPYKSLRPLKDSPCFPQEDVNINEASFSELRTKLEAWQFYQFKTQHPLDKWTASSLPNLYFTDMKLELRTHTVSCTYGGTDSRL